MAIRSAYVLTKVTDYEIIDLPVFTCSSRDYLRLKGLLFLATHLYMIQPRALGHAKGDGEPVCFSNAEDTGIPAVQSWCHQLTSDSRQRCATDLLRELETILATIKSYVGSRYNVSPAERTLLQRKWQTPGVNQKATGDNHQKRFKHSPDSDGDLNTLLYGRGIIPRLKQVFRHSLSTYTIYLCTPGT